MIIKPSEVSEDTAQFFEEVIPNFLDKVGNLCITIFYLAVLITLSLSLSLSVCLSLCVCVCVNAYRKRFCQKWCRLIVMLFLGMYQSHQRWCDRDYGTPRAEI